jgi:hypothetical protein
MLPTGNHKVSRSCKHCERDANTLKGAKFKKSLSKNWEFFLNLFQIFIRICFGMTFFVIYIKNTYSYLNNFMLVIVE